MTKMQHDDFKFPKQHQPEPGLQSKMSPQPDDGSTTYAGCNRLRGKKVLITGADSGIGRAVAIAYANEGADLVLNYLSEEESDAQDVRRIIESLGRKVELVPGDLKDEAFNKELVKQTVLSLGKIDTLVLVAGKQQANTDITTISTGQMIDTYTTNVFSLIWLVREALEYMPNGSSIITTNSIEAEDPSAYLIDYAGTKAAIKNTTFGLAKQLAQRGIRVNSVAPGPIWTPLQVAGGQLAKNIPTFGKDTPLGRAGQPSEVAGAYVFLASDEASYITATSINVTGGLI